MELNFKSFFEFFNSYFFSFTYCLANVVVLPFLITIYYTKFFTKKKLKQQNSCFDFGEQEENFAIFFLVAAQAVINLEEKIFTNTRIVIEYNERLQDIADAPTH